MLCCTELNTYRDLLSNFKVKKKITQHPKNQEQHVSFILPKKEKDQ